MTRAIILVAILVAALGLALGAASYSGLIRPRGATAIPSATPGLETGPVKGLAAIITVSKPGNGTHFVAGEEPVVVVTLRDKSGRIFDRAKDLGQLRLMASGPMETADTTTPVKLLRTSATRSDPVHHFVDLKTNADVQVQGNTLTYKLGKVSDEKPGTYTASIWAVYSADTLEQTMESVEFQIGTAVVEKQIVEKERCSSCHLGADSGKLYLHHIDPAQPNQSGNWSIDQISATACKTCHNNDGYAAYASPTDSSARVADPIVNRVHGIHMGEELKNPANTDPATGVFKNYRGVIFPANVKNCEACHADDRWKTKPSRLACGTCHDDTWFGDPAALPKGAVAHKDGPEADDSRCATCHPAEGGGTKGIAEAHKVSQTVNSVDVGLTPPVNGKFYEAGDRPQVTIVIKDDAGKPLADHTLVDTANFSTAGLFVYGTRADTVPVLTNAAKNGSSKLRASISNSTPAPADAKGWTFAAGDTFKISVNAGPVLELAAPAGLQTPAQVRDWLAGQLTGVTVTASATSVTIRSNTQGENSRIDIYDSKVTETMGWKPGGIKLAGGGSTAGVTMEPYVTVARASYPTNDLRKLSDPLEYSDPSVTRAAANITYQLDDVAGLPSGTYSVYVWIQPIAGKMPNVTRPAIGFLTFQIGTEREELKVATNCTSCHGNTIWHLDSGPQHPEPFDTDYCKACHDYRRDQTGDGFANQGGTSLNGWSGYGAGPLSRRIHGLHFGAYLDHPEQIYSGNPNLFSESIFPQDVRNCTKCHDPKGSSSWKQEPSRLACMACHDSDQANAHAILNTANPNPADPWSSTKVETCRTCHGAGREFSPDKVHNISNPYRPPYMREPE